MKAKTLLMVAGAGALVYWLWKKKSNEPRGIGKKDASKKASEGVDLMPFMQAATKEECESLGGLWFPEIRCAVAPCPKCFANRIHVDSYVDKYRLSPQGIV